MSGPQFSGNPPGLKAYLLAFYDSTGSYTQYYNPSAILGFEKINTTSFKIYIQGAKDVNAKDIITLTHTTAITYKDAVEYIVTAIAEGSIHVSSNKFLSIIGTSVPENLRPEFTSCTITYGTCCGAGGTIPKQLAKTTTTFEWNTSGGQDWCVPFGTGSTAVSFASNQLTDDQTRDAVLFDLLGKIEIVRIYGFLESSLTSGSVQLFEGTFTMGSSYTGTQTFTIGSSLGIVGQSAANTYYPFSITSGFASKAPGLMRALKLVNRNADTRVYKGQVTYEYVINE